MGRWQIVQYHVGMHLPLELLPELLPIVRAHEEDAGWQPADPPPPLDEAADDPATAAVRVLRGLHRAATAADGERFFAAFAPEAMIFGSTARLTLARYRALREPYLARGQGLPSTPIEQKVYLSASGDLAWFEELVEVFEHDRLRGTGVLRRIDGAWKLVHYSAMILVPRQLAGDFAHRIESFYAPD